MTSSSHSPVAKQTFRIIFNTFIKTIFLLLLYIFYNTFDNNSCFTNNVNDKIQSKSFFEQTEEDEETRAYRLEIEKQKAQREKLWRDKEMRRRKAAEELKKEEVSFTHEKYFFF